MKAFVAVTDRDWYDFLRRRPDLDEVNFWQPGGGRQFRALEPGQPFLFKLHYPDNFIVGGGFFAHASLYPASLAWEAFGDKNGAPSFGEMRRRIERYRRVGSDPHHDYTIGCIILEEPFFFRRDQWIPAPASFSANTVVGKSYDLREGESRRLWEDVMTRRQGSPLAVAGVSTPPMFGDPIPVRPRLGQGAFRVKVTDSYQRRCAVTLERTLPVFEAAHIRPVADGGQHRVENGLLLRSDIHTLFDRGYVTVTPSYQFQVSPHLKQDWQNGRVYYELDGRRIDLPQDREEWPGRTALEWHADVVYRR
ncbi:MAG TPA: HNH endonuclease [Gemmatimonadales bacterium]|nr:HNH endonuclease [Gemmatimonadales bacterium]